MTDYIQPIADIADENLSAYVGNKYNSYYQKKWQFTLGQLKGFNITAFFLGAIWLIYRKMYLYATIFLVIISLDIAVEMFYPLPEAIDSGLTWAIAAMFGVMGNYWYKTHADKKVSQICASFPSEQVPAELAKQGGTNLAAALITTVVVLALVGAGLWAIYSGKL